MSGNTTPDRSDWTNESYMRYIDLKFDRARREARAQSRVIRDPGIGSSSRLENFDYTVYDVLRMSIGRHRTPNDLFTHELKEEGCPLTTPFHAALDASSR